MNKNIGKNMGIVAVSAFIIQLIFRLMGDNNKSAIIRGIIAVVLCIILAVYMYRGTKKKLGNKLSIFGSILMVATGSTISVCYIIMNCYPQLDKQYKRLIVNAEMVSFVPLIIFLLIALYKMDK